MYEVGLPEIRRLGQGAFTQRGIRRGLEQGASLGDKEERTALHGIWFAITQPIAWMGRDNKAY